MYAIYSVVVSECIFIVPTHLRARGEHHRPGGVGVVSPYIAPHRVVSPDGGTGGQDSTEAVQELKFVATVPADDDLASVFRDEPW